MPSRRGSREPESEARTLLNHDKNPEYHKKSVNLTTPVSDSRKSSRKSSAFMRVGASIRKSFNVVGEAYDNVEDKACAGGSGSFTTIVNLIQSYLGSGIIIMPIALKEGTIIGSSLFMVLFCAIFGFTFWLLGEASQMTNAHSFRELWAKIFGKKTSWIIDLVLFLNAMAACLGHMIAYGDYFSKFWSYVGGQDEEGKQNFFLAFGYEGFGGRWLGICLTALFILFPLSIFKKLGPLRYTSTFGVCITFYVIFYLGYLFFSNKERGDNLEKYLTHPGLDKSFGFDCFFASVYFSSAFSCHANGPQLWSEYNNPTSKRYGKAVLWGFGFCMVVFWIAGFFGVGFFGDATIDNILWNFKDPEVLNGWSVGLWIVTAISIICCFPLVLAPGRQGFFGVMKSLGFTSFNEDNGFMRITTTFFLIACIATAAMSGITVGMVAKLKGIFLSNSLCLLGPCLMYIYCPDPSIVTSARRENSQEGIDNGGDDFPLIANQRAQDNQPEVREPEKKLHLTGKMCKKSSLFVKTCWAIIAFSVVISGIGIANFVKIIVSDGACWVNSEYGIRGNDPRVWMLQLQDKHFSEEKKNSCYACLTDDQGVTDFNFGTGGNTDVAPDISQPGADGKTYHEYVQALQHCGASAFENNNDGKWWPQPKTIAEYQDDDEEI